MSLRSASLALTTVGLLVGALALRAHAAAGLTWPEGYRHWTHVKSMVIGAGHPLVDAFGGIHHVYVNDTGLAALKAGKGGYPDGSVFAFDLLGVDAATGAQTEGGRKFVAVMVKDAKKYASTGGWGFQAFAGAERSTVVTDGGVSCFTCHQGQKPADYVFTAWRD